NTIINVAPAPTNIVAGPIRASAAFSSTAARAGGATIRSANTNGIEATATIVTVAGLYHQPRPASERVAVSIANHTSTAVSHAIKRKQRVAVCATLDARSR